MILSKQDALALNHFLTPAGAAGIKLLAEKLYTYYAKETIYSEGPLTEQYKGAGRLALLLMNLPETLHNVSTNN